MLLPLANRNRSKLFIVFFPLPSFANQRSESKLVHYMLEGAFWHKSHAQRPPPAKRLRHLASTASRNGPAYLLSPGLGPCSSMPAEEGTAPPPELLSARELWAGGSGPAGAKALPSVGGSGGWKAGDMCFLFRVPPRRWAWKSISFTPKLQREETVNTPCKLTTETEAHWATRVKTEQGQSPKLPSKQRSGKDHIIVIPITKASNSTWL